MFSSPSLHLLPSLNALFLILYLDVPQFRQPLEEGVAGTLFVPLLLPSLPLTLFSSARYLRRGSRRVQCCSSS